MAWIESHDELPTHPKTRKAARRLGISIPATIGHLHVLWYWCLTHRPDGLLTDMDAEDIADAALWEDSPDTFVEALSAAGWLDYDESAGHYLVHDWWDGAGKTIQRRRYASERQRRARNKPESSRSEDAGPPNNQQLSADSLDSHADVTRDSRQSNVADIDSDSDSDSKTNTSRKRSDRATRLPEDWIPKPEPELVDAIGGKQAANRELDKFRDYWAAQPGAKGRKVDWQATWRNWLRRVAENLGPQPKQGGWR